MVLSCSDTKRTVTGTLPAVDRYDGPYYRVLRTFLRTHKWPKDLSVAVLSAKHGLMGAMTPVENYNTRMTPTRAQRLSAGVGKTLEGWHRQHAQLHLVLGEDYAPAIEAAARHLWKPRQVAWAPGPIGLKQRYVKQQLEASAEFAPAERGVPKYKGRPAYFLPDWDDFVDAEFDFVKDEFSTKGRTGRKELHCSELVRPKRLADGILVSLAQSFGGKGLLRSLQADSADSLAPKQVKEHFGLAEDQWAFGDCGAFSYVNEDRPTISIDQAVATYELYGFDLGASVDHIPVPHVMRNGKPVPLTKAEQVERVKVTRRNAEAFMESWRRRECRFSPVGVVQALSPDGYADMVAEYAGELKYRRIALGGLVPKSDDEILAIVKAVSSRMRTLAERPWLHLMGVYRPKCQADFRAAGVDSFDSATYFRKSWLRSDQNYLGADGEWYAAIRVPPSHDPRTARRLEDSGVSEKKYKAMEALALRSLRDYEKRRLGLEKCLQAVLEYDRLLFRAESDKKEMDAAYRRTLEVRPWELCDCGVCEHIGIHALIFRGLNRNKRRGAHNTHALYSSLRMTPSLSGNPL